MPDLCQRKHRCPPPPSVCWEGLRSIGTKDVAESPALYQFKVYKDPPSAC